MENLSVILKGDAKPIQMNMWWKILIKKVPHFDYTIKYKKRYSTTQPRKIELAFLTRKFTSKQIAEENKKLNEFGLPNTILVIRQDSAFLADASQQKMASNEIQNSNNLVISELNKKLEQYTFDTIEIFRKNN